MGEDLRHFYGGGAFAVTPAKQFVDIFGTDRVRDTPISEAAIIGAAVGAAITGMRPVAELMFVDFFGTCADQLYNEAPKIRYMFGGQAKVPLVVRTAFGSGLSLGAHHSQTLYSIFAHCPGLKVVVPSTPFDAKGLLISAIRDDDPVMYFEHKKLYDTKAHVPENPYEIPLGKADIKREGQDLTIVATGIMVQRALDAAQNLIGQGIDAEVLDLRTISPLDTQAILESVKKTAHLIIVDEDYQTCGLGAEIAAFTADQGFDLLDAPIKRVCTANVPIPFSPVLEEVVVPSVERIEAAAKSISPAK